MMSMSVTDSQNYLVQSGCSLNCCKENRIVVQRRILVIISCIVAITILGLVTAVVVLAVSRTTGAPAPETTCDTPECNLHAASSTTGAPAPETTCDTPECNLHAAQLLYRLNQNVQPCHDFYAFACGKGLDDFVVNPPAYIQNDFSDQQAKINKRIQDLLNDDYETGSVMEKPVKMYKSCMNQNDPSSTEYLHQLLETLGGWPFIVGLSWNNDNTMSKVDDIFPYLINLSKYRQFGVLFTTGVIPDIYNTSRNLATLIQPSKSNLYPIVRTENLTKTIEAAFLHMVQYFNASITKESISKDLQDLLAVNDIIYHALPETDQTDMDYHSMTIEALMKETENKIQWLDYFSGVFKDIKTTTFSLTDYVGIQGLHFFKNISVELSQKFNQSVGRAIVNFEITQLLLAASEYTKNKEFILQIDDPNNAATTRSPWWSLCIKWASNWFGYSIANEYAKHFMDVSEAVRESEEITDYITQAYEERLSNLSWLDDEAHKAALDKIHQMNKYYVFPEWVKDTEKIKQFYAEFPIGNDNVGNSIAYNMFDNRRNYLRINGDSDSLKRWAKTPLEVNAFYMPSDNSINILQAILQPPVFGANRLRVMNFGSLGSIIGHEITHGFDLTGRQYDGKGNLVEWMSPDVVNNFMKRADCFVKQYEKYSLTSDDITGLNKVIQINGARTASENIADGGGIRNAYWAYKKWEKSHGTEAVPTFLKKFTNDQLFFISYAHTWCTKYADSSDALLRSITQDVHSPPRIRILGALSNFKEFADVFNCPAGENMNPTDRCILW